MRVGRTRSKIYICWGVLSWLAATAAGAQHLPSRFVNLSREDGLSDNSVEAIVEDHRGFMWFGTPDGLNRFDAHTFTVYRHDPADPRSLSDSYVLSLFEDRDRRLWIGTLNGLNRYDRATDSFIRYRHDPGDPASLSNNVVYGLHQDRDGGLWIGTVWGLDRFQPEDDTFVRYLPDLERPERGPNVPFVRVITEDRDGILWIGAGNGGLAAFDRRAGTFTPYRHDAADPRSLSHDDVWDVLEVAAGELWIATIDGLNRFDGAGGFDRFQYRVEVPGSLSSSHVDAVLEDRQGVLWIGTDGGGLNRFDPDTGRSLAHRHDPAGETTLGSDVVRTIYEDSKGDLWIGTYTGGVSFLNRNHAGFSYYRHLVNDPESLSHSAVLSFFEDPDGDLWIGTEGGLNHFDPETGISRRYRHDPTDPRSLGADAVLSVLRDSRGRLWAGTYYGGLNRLDSDLGTGSFTRFPHDPGGRRGPGNPHVWDVFEDATGQLWLGTFGGAYRFDPDAGDFTPYHHDREDHSSIGDSIIWSFFEDREGTLWLATQGGLSRYHRATDSFTTYRHDDADDASLGHNQVLSIHEDGAGILWLGTEGGGLGRFDRASETFSAFRIADGLPSNVVYGILEDGRGRLWLSTKEGLSRFDPETRAFINYNHSDGLLAYPFSRNACLTSRGGEMYFGGTSGFSRFFPDQVRDNAEIPPVALTGLQVFNRPVAAGDADGVLERDVSEARRIRLRHDQSVFSLTFSALNYRAPEKNRYAYMLEGFDQDWRDVTAERTATYTNLDPGSYVFRVKGSNNSGLWNDQGASVEIVVAPPWWKTWWFRTSAALATVAALFGVYWARTRSIRARNRALQAEIAERLRVEGEREQLLEEMAAKNAELERFAYTVSHDLKAPLVTIKGFLGMLKKDSLAGDTARMEHDIERIDGAADKMHQLMHQLLELSRVGHQTEAPEPVPLSELANEAVALFAEEIRQRGVTVEVGPDLPVAVGDRVRLLQVFQNLVQNAIKYMADQAKPRVEIGTAGDGPRAHCYVRDNGKGIDPRYHDKVFGLFERLDAQEEGTGVGLALVKRIVEMHGGRIWLESEGAGSGCTFCFTLGAGEGTA